MKTLITLILVLFTLSISAQQVPLVINGDTVYINLTPYMGDYVTETELSTALDTLSIDGVISDSVLTAQDLIDFYDFAAYDSALFVFPETIINYINGDTTNISVVDNGDSLYRQIDPDWDNWAKWYNTYRMQIFPVNFNYGWGETIEE